MPEAISKPAHPKPRGWSLVAAGLLLLALVLVVTFTSRSAFSSPLALVVVAAIGLAALLIQLRTRQSSDRVRTPLWFNVTGLVFAIVSVFADFLRLSASLMLVAALAAVLCFAISGIVMLRLLRRSKLRGIDQAAKPEAHSPKPIS